MKTYFDYLEMVNRYPKAFSKCNVNASTLTDLQNNYTITETYIKKENNRIVEKETKTVTAENYAYVISGCGFFKDRITKAYTQAGYIAVRFFARNPWDTSVTVSRDFSFTYNH